MHAAVGTKAEGKDSGGWCAVAMAESMATPDRDGGRATTIVDRGFLPLTLRVA